MIKIFSQTLAVFSAAVLLLPNAMADDIASLKKATQFMEKVATEGGFVWNYKVDLSERAGESICPPSIIWLQPPGTPSMGKIFLRAWQSTNDPAQLEAARAVALSLKKCQLGSGGWHYSGSFDPAILNQDGAPDYKGARILAGQPNYKLYPLYRVATTFDDGVTQSCTSFLIEYVAATKALNDRKDDPIRESLDRALAGMLKAQYPNGAWPERYEGAPRQPEDYPIIKAEITDDWRREWPAANEGEYVNYYTLNDRAQRDCISTMLLAHKLLGRDDCLQAAKRGGDFLILAQFPEPQPGWAQQYDFTMRPAWGRAWEVPGVTSQESRTALEALFELYLATGEDKYLKPIPPAIAWLKRSTLGPELWSRYYELGTNKPIYGDVKTGKIIYDIEQKPGSYSWKQSFMIPEFIAKFEEFTKVGREAWLARDAKPPVTKESLASLRKRADEAIRKLDSEGRWLVPGRLTKKTPELKEMISTREFINNVNRICDYLDAAKSQ